MSQEQDTGSQRQSTTNMNDAIGSKKNSIKDLLTSSSKPGSISNLASTGSRANLGGSQANIPSSQAGSQINLAATSQAGSRTGSHADLVGSKVASKVPSKVPSRIGSQANLNGSRVGSQTNLQQASSRIGSQTKLNSQTNLVEPKLSDDSPVIVESAKKDIIELPPQQIFDYLQLPDTLPRAEAIVPESAEFEFTKNYLKTEGVNGGNLYDHLTRIVVNLMETRPVDGLGIY